MKTAEMSADAEALRGAFGNVSNDNPLSIEQMAAFIQGITGNALVNVGGSLTWHANESAEAIASPADLIARIGDYASIDWRRGSRFHTKDEVFAGLKRHVPRYDWVSEYPHFPRLPRVLYVRPIPKARHTGVLDAMIERLNPATKRDTKLLKAMILTLFWGGSKGARPMFCVTSNDGRGSGKTKQVEMIASLVGGVVSVSAATQQNVADIKTRLLSAEGRPKRVALLDNLKSHLFSNADIESMVTAETISGRELYTGEGSRPNYVTWITTANGATMSTDMAQRTVVVRVKRPTYDANWETQVRTFAAENRDDIEAEVRWVLERGKTYPIETHTRRAEWEGNVLAKFPAPDKIIEALSAREAEIDGEAETKADLLDFIRRRLRGKGVAKPDAAWVQIATSRMLDWLKEFDDGINRKTIHGVLSQHAAGVLRYDRADSFRHWLWMGPDASNEQKQQKIEVH